MPLRLVDVSQERRSALEAGAASSNHIEQMALNMSALAMTQFGTVGAYGEALGSPRFLDRMRAGGQLAWSLHGEEVFDLAPTWGSDTARGWGAFAAAYAAGGLERQLSIAARFATDHHFAVREWAWLGARPAVRIHTADAVGLLASTCRDGSSSVRRFCVEVTRPRSVWGAHLPLLKNEPARGLPVLDQVATDSSRYVRLAVGNWVNDVARTHPRWALATCERWRRQHGPSVAFVCRRALRSLGDHL